MIDPPRRKRSCPNPDPSDGNKESKPRDTATEPAEKQGKRRRVEKNGKLKWEATGDHETGYARPPRASQFKPGNPGGPGRPEGSRSQDALMREELSSPVTLQINGRKKRLPKRALAPILLTKNALEDQNYKALVKLHEIARTLFPEESRETGKSDPLGDTAQDRAILAKLMLSSLTMGEPDPNNPKPLADLGLEGPDLKTGIADGDWVYENDVSSTDDEDRRADRDSDQEEADDEQE